MHPIADYCEMDPLDHAIWLPADQPMMDAAAYLLVVRLESWEISYGIAEEIKHFAKAGKPIFYLDPVTFELSEMAEAAQ